MGILSQIRETKRLVTLAQGNAVSFHDTPIQFMKDLLNEITKIEELKTSQIQKKILLAKSDFEKYNEYSKMSQHQRAISLSNNSETVKTHTEFCKSSIDNLTLAESECVQFIENLEKAKKTYLEKYKHLMGRLD